MKGTCLDVLGTKFEFDEGFDLQSYLKGFKSGMWARVPGVKRSGEPLALMADALVNIEDMMRADREAN